MRPHDWTRSTLGHGNMMCKACKMTDLEALALSCFYDCSSFETHTETHTETKEERNDVVYLRLRGNGGFIAHCFIDGKTYDEVSPPKDCVVYERRLTEQESRLPLYDILRLEGHNPEDNRRAIRVMD